MVLSVRGFEFKSPSYHLALSPWASHFPSLDPRVLIFKMKLIKPTLFSRIRNWVGENSVKVSNNGCYIISPTHVLPRKDIHEPWVKCHGGELEDKCVTFHHLALRHGGSKQAARDDSQRWMTRTRSKSTSQAEPGRGHGRLSKRSPWPTHICSNKSPSHTDLYRQAV